MYGTRVSAAIHLGPTISNTLTAGGLHFCLVARWQIVIRYPERTAADKSAPHISTISAYDYVATAVVHITTTKDVTALVSVPPKTDSDTHLVLIDGYSSL